MLHHPPSYFHDSGTAAAVIDRGGQGEPVACKMPEGGTPDDLAAGVRRRPLGRFGVTELTWQLRSHASLKSTQLRNENLR